MHRLRPLLALGLLALSPLAFAQHHPDPRGPGRYEQRDHRDHRWQNDRYRNPYHDRRYETRPVILHHPRPGYYPIRHTPHGWYDRWGHFHPYRRW